MNETEQYFFDLSGYIVVRNVLSAADVTLANEAIDRHEEEIHERVGEMSLADGAHALQGSSGRGDLGGALSWADPVAGRSGTCC
jgi:ectoine hydroxylase-related dioxygenase (phytanoyl-CoA dioxygenase family)